MGVLQLSEADWCYYRDGADAAAFYRAAEAIGITGAEMVDPSRWAAARAAGLTLLNISGPGMTYGLNRTAHHVELLPALHATIDTAQQNGIRAVIIFSGNRDGLPDEMGIANCIDGITELAPHAEQAGVQLHFEMLCAHNHPDYQADHSAFGFRVVREVASPAVKVLYDIYHMVQMGEDVCADILDNLDIIGHLHVAEVPERTLPLPGGQTDYPSLVGKVMEAGYRGYWGFEFLPGGEAIDELCQAAALFQTSNP